MPAGRPQRRERRIGWPAVVALAAGLSACGTSGGSPAGSSPTTTAPQPVAALVAPTPTGFRAEATDKDSGGKTGSIGIAEAASADCDGVAVTDLRQERWSASELRYFDDDPAYPDTYVLLCVTRLGTASDAERNQEQLVGARSGSIGGLPAPTPFSVSGIPGAAGFRVGPGSEISFAKGRYLVFVVGAGVSSAGLAAAGTLATDLASAQYRRLPS